MNVNRRGSASPGTARNRSKHSDAVSSLEVQELIAAFLLIRAIEG